MALTFACPSCRAELQLPDEAAGQSGQCPRCQAVMRIPSSTQMRAVVLEPGTSATPAPQAAPPPPKQIPPYERPPAPRRQARPPLPTSPPEPVRPAIVGVVGTLICAALLFASVVVLFSVRSSERF